MWELIKKDVDTSDDQIKRFVFSCLSSYPDIFVQAKSRRLLDLDYAEISQMSGEVEICITEDKLWSTLTGYRKKECSIGGLAFELLLEVTKTKEIGINTMELARQTSQDPRSITGRIKKLGSLVTGTQIIFKGHVVKHLKYYKFADKNAVVNSYVGMRDHLSTIVSIVKNSKNGVRQLIDLKRELKFDKDKRLSKSFIAAIAWLDEKAYLKKVLVVSPSSPSVKIRCVKYLRDYVPEEKSTNDFEDDTDGDDESGQAANDDKNGDEEEAFECLDSFNATHLLQEQNLILQDAPESEKKEFLLNRFFPMQNQTYALAARYGTTGVSTMEAVNLITGQDYKRSFTKCSEYYVDTVGKPTKNSSGNGLVRVYDFEGKKKFYRLFTEYNFRSLSGLEPPQKEEAFSSPSKQKKTLDEISRSNFVPLSNTLRFINKNGEDQFFWNGELKVPSNGNAAPRGRKRKNVLESVKSIPKRVRKDEPLSNDLSASNISHPQNTSASDPSENSSSLSSNNALFSIDGFSANSLKSLQRQRAILETIKNCGGISFFRDQLFMDVTKLMGSKTLLDKKTIKGDVERLVCSKKVCLEIDRGTGRRLLTLPHITREEVLHFLSDEKDSKKSYFNDVIQNTDIYFFDQTESNRFHRGTKSAERVKKFEKTRDKSRKTNDQNNQASINIEGPKRRSKVSEKFSTKQKLDNNEGLDSSTLVKKGKKSNQNTFNIGTKDGVRTLVMAVVIIKSIKGQIVWETLSEIFPNNSVGNLKKQWTIRRVRMGHSGWKAQLEKWRKIIVEAMKEGKATLEDVEKSNLIKLIKIWNDFEAQQIQKPFKLFKNYEENFKRYTFVRDSVAPIKAHGLDMSSMVQREHWLLRKAYTYSTIAANRTEKVVTEDKIRTVARSLLIESPGSELKLDDIEALKRFKKEEVDKVLLDMAKERQISLVGMSKLQLTDTVLDFLSTKGDFSLFDNAMEYNKKLVLILSNRKACLISGEISNSAAVVFLHLIETLTVNIQEIPVFTKEIPMHYTTRKYEVGALTPPLVFIAKKRFQDVKLDHVQIPIGKPCSHLWIDLEGNVRPDVWKKVVALSLKEILFNPGITRKMLAYRCRKVLSFSDIESIVSWCLARSIVCEIEFEGLIANDNWFKAFS